LGNGFIFLLEKHIKAQLENNEIASARERERNFLKMTLAADFYDTCNLHAHLCFGTAL